MQAGIVKSIKKILLLRWRRFACFAFLLAANADGYSQIRLPRLISDGMVLQRDVPVKIWGWAAAGESISIHFAGESYPVRADARGNWNLLLKPLKAGGPYEMDIEGSNHIRLKNILVGDVWICSGQSNMVLPMERVRDKYEKEILLAGNPMIRQFLVSTAYDFNTSHQDLSSGTWESCSTESVLHFTAAGYFFAKTLFEKYHVPIGLINASVGGSPVQAWLSEDALKSFPDYFALAKKFRDPRFTDSIRTKDSLAGAQWYAGIWNGDSGLHASPSWLDINYQAGDWQTAHIPSSWKDMGLKDVYGVVWYRKEIELTDAMANKPARLLLGRIVDRDSVYVNGHFIGTTGYQYPPRKYRVGEGILKSGKNEIVVRVINGWGSGGFVLDKPYQLIIDADTIRLEGDWKFKLGLRTPPLSPQTFFQYQPMGLYNAMISPLVNYLIKGVIWYQGEANTSKPDEYQELFSSMITDWRKKWQMGNFPFLFVQLANFMETKDEPGESQWAALRDAQRKTLALPNTAMAVTLDIGEWNDIHPLNKMDVGKRLALGAEKIAYGDKKVHASGPLYQSMEVQGGRIVLNFANDGTGLIARDGSALKYFSVAAADKKFVWAKARIEGNKVIVWNDSISRPVAVRYAWADNPSGANLYSKNGLPASSFRTDNW